MLIGSPQQAPYNAQAQQGQPQAAQARRGAFGRRRLGNISNGLLIAGASLQDAFGDTRGNVQSTLGGIQSQQNMAYERQQYEQEMMRQQQQAAQARQAQEQQQAKEASALSALNLSAEDLARYNLGAGLPQPPKRSIIKGADGYQYYQDDGSRVLPGVQAPPPSDGGQNVQSTFTDADGFLNFVRRDGTVERTEKQVRNNQQFVDVGGVAASFDRSTGRVNPLTTPQEVGGNAAEIETIKQSEKTRLAAQEDLPGLRDTANQALAQIDGLLAHEGFESRYGLSSLGGLIPPFPESKGAGAQAYINQIQGAAFLQAFESLRGGGSITVIEGEKATDAITRLTNQSLGPDEATKAAEELKAILRQGLSRMALRSTGEQGGAVTSDITEDDIQHTMRVHGMTREQVLARLEGR